MTNPNQELTPIYDGEEIVWVPVIEYYVLMARLAIGATDEQIQK